MLGKLFKHEFKQTSRVIPLLYIILVLCSLTFIVGYKTNINWLIGIGIMLCIFSAIAVIAATFIVIIVRFYKSMFLNEGYLTYTLPVKPSANLFPKFTVALFWIFSSIIVILGVFLLVLFSLGVFNTDFMKTIYNNIFKYDYVVKMLILTAVMMVIQTIFFLMQVFFAMSLGNTPAFHKLSIGGPILIYIVMYFIIQLINLVLTLFIPIGVSIGPGGFSFVFENMLTSFTAQTGSNVTIGLAGIIFEVVGTIALFFVTKYILDKKVSLK